MSLSLNAVAEPWSAQVLTGIDGSIILSGNSRAYLFEGDMLQAFDLRRKTLRFSVRLV